MISEPGEHKDEALEPVILIPVAPPTHRLALRLQHLMFAVGVCAFLVWLGMAAGLFLLTGGVVLLAGGLTGLSVVLTRRATTHQESLLWALAIAADRGLPLAPAAIAFADQFGRSYRARVQLLATLLNEGLSLPEALQRIPGLVTREVEVLLKISAATGTLGRGFREAAAVRSVRQTAWGALASQFAYLGFTVLILQLVTSFVMYFIAPKYQAIFEDFVVPLPQVTLLTLHASAWLTSYGGIPYVLVLFLEAFLVLLVPMSVFKLFQWEVPLLDALFRRRHAALVLRSLAMAVEGGKPMSFGIASLAENYPSAFVRRRLRRVRRRVEQGTDWVLALAEAGLLHGADAAVIASAQRVGNLDWALRETADGTERRFGYRLQFWIQLLVPVVIMGLGSLILVMCVAYFYPLVRLIEVLAG